MSTADISYIFRQSIVCPRNEKKELSHVSRKIFLFLKKPLETVKLPSHQFLVKLQECGVWLVPEHTATGVRSRPFELRRITYGLNTFSFKIPDTGGSKLEVSIEAACSKLATALTLEGSGSKGVPELAHLVATYRPIARLSKRMKPSSYNGLVSFLAPHSFFPFDW